MDPRLAPEAWPNTPPRGSLTRERLTQTRLNTAGKCPPPPGSPMYTLCLNFAAARRCVCPLLGGAALWKRVRWRHVYQSECLGTVFSPRRLQADRLNFIVSYWKEAIVIPATFRPEGDACVSTCTTNSGQ